MIPNAGWLIIYLVLKIEIIPQHYRERPIIKINNNLSRKKYVPICTRTSSHPSYPSIPCSQPSRVIFTAGCDASHTHTHTYTQHLNHSENHQESSQQSNEKPPTNSRCPRNLGGLLLLLLSYIDLNNWGIRIRVWWKKNRGEMGSPKKNENKGFFAAMTSGLSMFGNAMHRSINGYLPNNYSPINSSIFFIY